MTRYIVYRDHEGLHEIDRVEASSALSAIRSALGENPEHGHYGAVPEGNLTLVKVTVEPQRPRVLLSGVGTLGGGFAEESAGSTAKPAKVDTVSAAISEGERMDAQQEQLVPPEESKAEIRRKAASA